MSFKEFQTIIKIKNPKNGNNYLPNKAKNSDVLLVSYDNVSNDKPVLIVGRKGVRGSVQIVNAFQDEEAEELYKKLTTKSK